MKDKIIFIILAAALALAAFLGISLHLQYWGGLIVAAVAYLICVIYLVLNPKKQKDVKFNWAYFLAGAIGGAFISLCFGLALIL